MALKTINDLTADASPQTTDLVATWDGQRQHIEEGHAGECHRRRRRRG